LVGGILDIMVVDINTYPVRDVSLGCVDSEFAPGVKSLNILSIRVVGVVHNESPRKLIKITI